MSATSNIIINIIPAVMMMTLTVITAWIIVYLVFFRKRERKGYKPSGKKNKEYSDCKLNEIMGYDFIQIKTVDKKEEKTQKKYEDDKPVISFADSKGTGTIELMNTESTDEDYYDITDEDIYETEKEDLSGTTEHTEEINPQDEDDKIDISMHDEYSNDIIQNMESIEDWPESSIPPDQKDSFVNWLYSGVEQNEVMFQSEQNDLSETSPEEKQFFYEDREQISSIMEKLQSMHDNNYMTPEQEEAFNNISRIGVIQKTEK